jgi:hypothetical protein
MNLAVKQGIRVTNAKNALFKKLLTLLCTLSVATPCKPEYSFKNKREEEMYAAGFYGGIFLTCVVGYQLWKWNSSVVESRHQATVAEFQRSLTTAEGRVSAAESELRRNNNSSLRQHLAQLEDQHASLSRQHEALKLINNGLEEYCQTLCSMHNGELQRIREHHAPRPMPSAPQQGDVELAPPAYPGKPLG